MKIITEFIPPEINISNVRIIEAVTENKDFLITSFPSVYFHFNKRLKPFKTPMIIAIGRLRSL